MESGIVKIQRGNEYKSKHLDTGLEYYLAYNELYDNALDNNATKINNDSNGDSITVADNGTGIKDTIEDMQRVLRMYKSSNEGDLHKTGEYGIGFKDATMRLGKGVHIRSRAPGCRTIEIDISWKYMDYETGGAEFKILENDDSDYGTSITIFYDEDTRKPPLPTRKSFCYYDNLIRAKKLQFIIDGKMYEPYMEPAFIEPPQVLSRVMFDKKMFDIKIGILTKSISATLSGFYVYSTETLRYYKVADTYLDDKTDAKDGIYCSIALYGTKSDWIVDKNKRGIVNIDIVAKYLEMYGILAKWKQQLYNSKKTEILSDIAQKLAPYFGLKPVTIGEEKRAKTGSQKGTIKKGDSNKKRLKASKVAEHEYKKVVQKYGHNITGLDVQESAFNDPNKYLSISKGSEHEIIVYMNKNNKFISKLLLSKSTALVPEFLSHFITLALKANTIPGNQITYGLVDELFTQHECFEEE